MNVVIVVGIFLVILVLFFLMRALFRKESKLSLFGRGLGIMGGLSNSGINIGKERSEGSGGRLVNSASPGTQGVRKEKNTQTKSAEGSRNSNIASGEKIVSNKKESK